MQHSQLIQLVLDMRHAQKTYFKNRSNKAEAKSYLERAMKLEAEVDHALNNIDHQCNFNHNIKHHANTIPVSNSPEGEQCKVSEAPEQTQQPLCKSVRQVVRTSEDGC